MDTIGRRPPKQKIKDKTKAKIRESVASLRLASGFAGLRQIFFVGPLSIQLDLTRITKFTGL